MKTEGKPRENVFFFCLGAQKALTPTDIPFEVSLDSPGLGQVQGSQTQSLSLLPPLCLSVGSVGSSERRKYGSSLLSAVSVSAVSGWSTVVPSIT